MKIITHYYDGTVEWEQVVAKAMGGVVDGKFVKGDNSLYKGTHVIMDIDSDISAMLVDTLYMEDAVIKYRSEDIDMIALNFYITNKNIDFNLNNETKPIGKLHYNLSIIDVSLPTDYIVDKGTHIYAISIFIKREALKRIFHKIPDSEFQVEDIFNKNKNTIIRMARMSDISSTLISDFRKIPYEHSFYEMYFRGIVYGLITSYLEKVPLNKIIVMKVIEEDFKKIFQSKINLLKNLESQFPGIEQLAKEVSMSASKYKKIFLKITGSSPGIYFSNNKLHYAKELLESGKYTVNEVSDKLNYYSVSYFAKRFKEAYGVFPKEYQSSL